MEDNRTHIEKNLWHNNGKKGKDKKESNEGKKKTA